MNTIMLREVAHARSGEKGNTSTISVIAYRPQDYALLKEQITVQAVQSVYGPIVKGRITRYEAPRIGALNFVLENVLEGGRSRTLAFEESGKALSSLMVTLPIDVPDDFVPWSKDPQRQQPPADLGLPPPEGKLVRLAAATAWSRDRFEPASALVAQGGIDYLCFECMSEVTMSAAQAAIRDGGSTVPYDPYLIDRMRPILKDCKEKGIKVISNQGWLDPVAAAKQVCGLAHELGIADLKVAAVSGGNLTSIITELGIHFIENGQPVSACRESIVSAEAYMGGEGIAHALAGGADVVLTTRVADAALYYGPLAHEFGWQFDDYPSLGKGMVIGHLMECCAQVCGGYFADPGYKDVPHLVELGNPIVEVSKDRIVLTKQAHSGGLMSVATCKEQLLYEVHDPSAYYGPDCVTDLSEVEFRQIGPDRVEVITHDVGQPRPQTLKTLVGITEGFMTEEMVIFAGPSALERARMTQDLLQERFRRVHLQAEDVRFDYLGINSVHREASPSPNLNAPPYEVILRVAVKTTAKSEAEKVRREIDPLAVNGVYGTGKWATTAGGSRVREIIGLDSCLVPREHAPWQLSFHH